MPRRSRIPTLIAGLAFGAAAVPTQAQISLPPDYVRRQLSPSGEAASAVSFLWKVDARGEWVVFVGDVEDAGAEAVYSMRRSGSELHRLSAYGPIGTIDRLELSADGRRVLYSGDLETVNRSELWSAPLAGPLSAVVKLSVPVDDSGLLYFSSSAVSGRVVYLASQSTGDELWSVPAAGPAAANVRLDPGFGATAVPNSVFLLGGTPERVAQTVVDPGDLTSRLWSVPSTGPAAAGAYILSAGPPDCLAFPFAFAPASTRVGLVYACADGPETSWNLVRSVPIAGPESEARSIAGSFVPGGGVLSISSSADGETVVFLADKLTLDRFELFSVPLAGPSTNLVRLNPALGALSDVTDFAISPDGARVAYIADAAVNERYQAYSVPATGPSNEAVGLDTLSVAGRDVTHVKFPPFGDQVVFRANFDEVDVFDLYRVPADGSEAEEQLTNDNSIPGFSRPVGTQFAFHPDGERVVYLFDEDAANDSRGLGEQKLFGSYVQDARLNVSPVAGGRVREFVVFSDSAGTIYRSDQDVSGSPRLYTTDSRIFGDGFEEGTSAAWDDLP